MANQSDVIVAVIGEASEMSGESASRSDIRIPVGQRQLVEALKKTGKPLVLVVMAGRPLIINWEIGAGRCFAICLSRRTGSGQCIGRCIVWRL